MKFSLRWEWAGQLVLTNGKRLGLTGKRPSRCRRVVLKLLIIRACGNAVISSWLRHYTGRHENHTGSIGLLFTHKNSCGVISVTGRSCAAPISEDLEESEISGRCSHYN